MPPPSMVGGSERVGGRMDAGCTLAGVPSVLRKDREVRRHRGGWTGGRGEQVRRRGCCARDCLGCRPRTLCAEPAHDFIPRRVSHQSAQGQPVREGGERITRLAGRPKRPNPPVRAAHRHPQGNRIWGASPQYGGGCPPRPPPPNPPQTGAPRPPPPPSSSTPPLCPQRTSMRATLLVAPSTAGHPALRKRIMASPGGRGGRRGGRHGGGRRGGRRRGTRPPPAAWGVGRSGVGASGGGGEASKPHPLAAASRRWAGGGGASHGAQARRRGALSSGREGGQAGRRAAVGYGDEV